MVNFLYYIRKTMFNAARVWRPYAAQPMLQIGRTGHSHMAFDFILQHSVGGFKRFKRDKPLKFVNLREFRGLFWFSSNKCIQITPAAARSSSQFVYKSAGAWRWKVYILGAAGRAGTR